MHCAKPNVYDFWARNLAPFVTSHPPEGAQSDADPPGLKVKVVDDVRHKLPDPLEVRFADTSGSVEKEDGVSRTAHTVCESQMERCFTS